MKNFIAKGSHIDVALPYDRLTSGLGAQVGQFFGVCTNGGLSGAADVLVVEGVFELLKAGTQAWTVGALIYWDNTAKVCTTVSTSNLRIGWAHAAVGAGAGETLGQVRLNAMAAPAGA